MKLIVDKYFDTLDYLTEVNGKEFEELDLSEIFTPAPDKELLLKIKEKYTKLNNFNRIYVLVAYQHERENFKLELNKENKK
jgi:hypothetical protein